MDAKFWIKKWNEGQIGFHQNHFNETLLKYFPLFNYMSGEKILVPLCGKTKDLVWLRDQGLNVRGVELYEKAAEAFFRENSFTDVIREVEENFLHLSISGLTISCGDFLEFNQKEKFDFVYDRASLVALPEEMRKLYADVIRGSLKPNGMYLLIVYEYNQSDFEGPPFSVSEKEVTQLYGRDFEIELLEEQQPSLEKIFIQKTYFLQRR